MIKVKQANGITGCLLRVGWVTWVFRVYNEDKTFTDYDLHHSDLNITIADEDAYFYTSKDKNILDHSPKTLGRTMSDG